MVARCLLLEVKRTSRSQAEMFESDPEMSRPFGAPACQLFPATSTVPGFFVVHETKDAREFIEAEVASFSFPLAVFVFGVPVSQENIPVYGREVGLTNRTSKLRVQRLLRTFQMRDRIQAAH